MLALSIPFQTGNRLTLRGPSGARVFHAAGIEDASLHSGRRWFITKLAHSGISPKVIMELAGHKQLTTTQRYIDVTDEQKRNAVEVL